ncbi:MAG TPA: DUF4197 domain-containing protein [Fibrobacteria bacterium]|nr:DUF4197 domain-containing protein [Fibrobacteria bacterium]
MTLKNPRMTRALALATALFSLGACTLEDVLDSGGGGGGGGSLEQKVVLGLKTALEVGIDTSASLASRVDGYLGSAAIRILLPEEAEDALKAAEKVGAYVQPFQAELKTMQTLVDITPGADKNAFASNLAGSAGILADVSALESLSDSLVKYMNRAAEKAAPRSVPIFKSAITNMTIADGLALLNSGSDSTAATGYLRVKTFNPLVTSYTPLVDSTLALVPLTRYWTDFRTAYNAMLNEYQKLLAFQASWNGSTVVKNVPALQVEALGAVTNQPIATESLGAWTTEKALVGLFFLVGEEEREIRRDPFAYASDLAATAADILKEVFGEIMERKD